MIRAKRTHWAGVALLAVAVPACSPSVPGQAGPSSSAASSALQSVVQDPCGSLPAEAVAGVQGSLDRSAPDRSANGPMCTWHAKDGEKPVVSLQVFENLHSVQDLRSANGASGWSEESSPVAGLPTVHDAIAGSPREQGQCRSTVVAPGGPAVGVDVNAQGISQGSGFDACAQADKLLGLVVERAGK